jgi:hypothetical protein
MLGEIAQVRVGDDRDLLHVLVVIADESDVGHHRPQTVPTRKVGHVDDEAGEVAVVLDLGVDGLGQFSEVILVERGYEAHAQNPVGLVEFVVDHVSSQPFDVFVFPPWRACLQRRFGTDRLQAGQSHQPTGSSVTTSRQRSHTRATAAPVTMS